MINQSHKAPATASPKAAFIYMAAVVCFTMASCVKKPVFIDIDSVKVGQLHDSLLDMQINFKVYNPNGVNSTLKASDVKTYYKDKLVGSSTITSEMALPGKDTIIIPLQTQVNIWSLAGVFPELLSADEAVFRIEGNNKVKALGVNWDIPVKENIKLNVRRAVSEQLSKTFKSDSNFKITQLKLSRVPGLSKTGIDVGIQVTNAFSFDYKLLGLNLDVYRNGGTNAVATWRLTNPIAQKAGAVSNIPIHVEVDNLNLLGEARLSDIFDPKIDVLLKGEAIIEIQGRTFTIPIRENRKVSFNPISGLSF